MWAGQAAGVGPGMRLCRFQGKSVTGSGGWTKVKVACAKTPKPWRFEFAPVRRGGSGAVVPACLRLPARDCAPPSLLKPAFRPVMLGS